MTARTTTTAFHETECDRCRTIEASTGDAGSQPALPDGWRTFVITCPAREGPRPPWSGETISMDLCPGCQPRVSLADCIARIEQNATQLKLAQGPTYPPYPPPHQP